MTLSVYNKQHQSDMIEMQDYIDSLKELNRNNPDKAIRDASRSLRQSGILDENGYVKKQICK